jgi:DNA-binding SARP family transcriptional activator
MEAPDVRSTPRLGRASVQVLGPVRTWRDGQEIDLGGTGPRAVLGLLAIAGGYPVPRRELVTALWNGRPPPSAVNVIQTYVKRLRHSLEPARPARTRSTILPWIGDGYALRDSTVDLDLTRFRRLVGVGLDAHRGGDLAQAAERLGEALSIWHGAPLADLAFLAEHPDVVALAAERWAAVARYGEAMLDTGRASEAVSVLEAAVVAQPLDEAAHVRLVRAYRAAGRRGEAFDAYHAVRRRLVDELGVDPGRELVAVHADLLAEDRGPAPAAPLVVPAQLPADTAGFAGRADQLRRLDALLLDVSPASSPLVICVAGTGGVGKTTLAVHWAHRVVARFPDGQLYVNLRGFGPSGSAMSATDAVRGFLAAIEVPPARIPAGLDAQVGLYRSLLSGRRMLIVLDNARDTEQVRPLLPAAPGCLALVTSRNELAGLATAGGAHPLRLEPLPVSEAGQLLERRLGAGRLAAEPAATGEIVDRCGGLPLALAIAAARAAARPRFPLAALASELRASRDNLDGFAGGEQAADLRAAFSWSYQALTPTAARLFRLLSLHPGPDLTAPAAASLAGVPPARIRPLLAELTRAHLLDEPTPGRYALHDLLRAYATELVSTVDDEPDRRAARHRLLDHYLHTAHRGVQLMEPERRSLALAPAPPGTTPEELTDLGMARAWFAAERAVLLGAVAVAARHDLDRYAWQLPWMLEVFLEWQGHWTDLVTTQTTAIRAGARLDDQRAQAHAHRVLVHAYGRLRRFDEARRHGQQAFALNVELGHPGGLAAIHRTLSWLLECQHRYGEGLHHDQRALELYRAAGNPAGEADALNAIGWSHALLGDHRLALQHCQQALAIFIDIDHTHGQANTWDSIGYAHHHLGDHEQAIRCYRTAIGLYRKLGNRYYGATTLVHLGESELAAGDAQAARATWARARDILDELGHPDAEPVRARLHQQPRISPA